MAILNNIKLNNGLNVESAYIKITYIEGTKDNINFTTVSYISKDAILEGKNCLEVKTYNFKPNIGNVATNFIKQGYEYLKTLPDFVGATDLLDEGQTT